MKIVTIIGARPQIIKAAALSRAIKEQYSDRIQEVIVHTGQHYDDNMSQVFFNELGIPNPNYNLHAGLITQATQTAQIMQGMESILNMAGSSTLITLLCFSMRSVNPSAT